MQMVQWLYHVQNDIYFEFFTWNALNDISWFFNNFLKKFSKHLAIENVLIYQVMNIVLVTTHCSGVSNHYTNWHKNSNQSSESQENVTYYMFL